MNDLANIDLGFVENEKLRGVLLAYHSQAIEGEKSGCYLGALIGSGAVVEGLLTWALYEFKERALEAYRSHWKDAKQPPNIETWDVSKLITIAGDIGLIGPKAKDACWAIKEFRNFIHPYNLLKQSARPDGALAVSALAGVKEVVRSVRGRIENGR